MNTFAQFKNDNVLYKTIDPAELCATMEKNKGYLLLDVRSKAEHYDTSSSPSYNLGHLKGARNIDIRELGTRISEIKDYRDQPVFVYCSHSQRSRRAGKMLADSGFTKVFNINGGMTAIHYTNAGKKTCLSDMIETANTYDIISAGELCERLNNKKQETYILDVRSDSAYDRISLDPKVNAYGTLRGSHHIQLAELIPKLSLVPKGQEIVITDMYGDEAARAAVLLTKNGYDKVAILIEGIDRLLLTDDNSLPCKKQIYESPVSYQLIPAMEFGKMAIGSDMPVILDIRTVDEFTNKYKDSWKNIGHIKNAINIPVSEIEGRIAELDKYKDKEIVIYSFGSSPEAFAAANILQKQGFKHIKLLMGGIFSIRWTAGNVKGQAYLKDLVVDVPESNL
jgi:rhodanese-related sulfurtransferase